MKFVFRLNSRGLTNLALQYSFYLDITPSSPWFSFAFSYFLAHFCLFITTYELTSYNKLAPVWESIECYYGRLIYPTLTSR